MHKQVNRSKIRSAEYDYRSILAGIDSVAAENEATETLIRAKWPDSSLQDLLWHEVVTEYDARGFSQALAGQNFDPSESFRRFRDSWLRDEWLHYSGFRHIYRTLFPGAEASLDAQLARRRPALPHLGWAYDSEFDVCVLLAFDEIMTTKSYSLDIPIYDSLGSDALSRWIRLVARDEVFHFLNLIDLLRTHHADRLAEVPALLQRMVDYRQEVTTYGAHFVLDFIEVPKEVVTSAKALMLKLCDPAAKYN